MTLLRFAAALALIVFLISPAIGQDAVVPTTTGNFLNIVLGAAAMLLTTVIIPLVVLWGRQMIAERELKLAQIQEQARAVVGGLAQKAIGGEMGADGTLRDGAVTRAAANLASNASESFAVLGVTPAEQRGKAQEVIQSTVGLMNAQAAGNPVPNPSLPVAAPASQAVPVKK